MALSLDSGLSFLFPAFTGQQLHGTFELPALLPTGPAGPLAKPLGHLPGRPRRLQPPAPIPLQPAVPYRLNLMALHSEAVPVKERQG